jgi:hypothetical protein
MKLKKYTLQQLQDAVNTSTSVRETLQKLNVICAGGNYATFHKAIKHFNIDIKHFTGKLSAFKLRGRTGKNLIPLESILKQDTNYSTNTLRKRLLKNNHFNHVCSSCANTTWMGAAIPLELDHINGVRTDNRIENLRLLCPNCHALTSTYRGKNKKTS